MKFKSYILLYIILIGATPLKEFYKIPLLIAHYLEHKVENETINLKAFFKLHYSSGTPMDADCDKDMQLPFKTYDFSQTITVFVFQKIQNVIHYYSQKVVFNLKNNFSIISKLSSQYLFNFWQPPKL